MAGGSNKTARNEKRKLAATLVNNVAAASLVTGLIVPAVAATYQTAYPQARFWWLFAVLWFAAGAALHLLAQFILGRLEE